MNKKQKNIADLLMQQYNFDVSKFDDVFLKKSLAIRIIKSKCTNEVEYCKFLSENINEVHNLKKTLYISYSEFFRNSLTFSTLEHNILAKTINNQLKNNQCEIRIWSVACAAGQEVYSLAILLKELNLNDNIKVRVFATDQSKEEIEKAKIGQYNYSDISQMSIKRLNNWMIKDGDTYFVKDELKTMIDFSTFDLLNSTSPGLPASIFCDFDIIICANILYYYKHEAREMILKRLKNCMTENGYLITSETERDIVSSFNFNETYIKSAIFKK